MRNIDVFAASQHLEEELVKQVAEDKIEESKVSSDAEELQKQQQALSLMEWLEKAPRKIKRKVAPERKFGNVFKEVMRKKRIESN